MSTIGAGEALTCDIPGGPVALVLYPGTVGCSPAHTALFDGIGRLESGDVFIAGPGATLTAVWAARSGAKIVTWNDSVAEARSITATLAANALRETESHVDWGFGALRHGSADLALLHLPRGREVQAQLIGACASILRPEGSLALVGAKNEGVKAALAEARRVFGLAGVVSRKGSYHAILAAFDHPGRQAPTMPDVPFRVCTVEVDGNQAMLCSCDGVFAPDRLDGGTAALIKSMDINAGETALDLGCGTGLVGLAALRRGAQVIATDVSARAVVCAERTHSANGFPGTPVHLCIGASALAPASVDVVLANPPFHKGHGVDYSVSRLFVEESARVLRPTGRLYLVANAFLNYRPWLEQHFRYVTLAQEDRSFKVWCARL
jgi:16S rRNA (guanine1207-N2)-methyltransferase